MPSPPDAKPADPHAAPLSSSRQEMPPTVIGPLLAS
jgi:hypothetical protein